MAGCCDIQDYAAFPHFNLMYMAGKDSVMSASSPEDDERAKRSYTAVIRAARGMANAATSNAINVQKRSAAFREKLKIATAGEAKAPQAGAQLPKRRGPKPSRQGVPALLAPKEEVCHHVKCFGSLDEFFAEACGRQAPAAGESSKLWEQPFVIRGCMAVVKVIRSDSTIFDAMSYLHNILASNKKIKAFQREPIYLWIKSRQSVSRKG